MLEVAGRGDKDKVANTQGRCAPTEAVEQLGSDNPDLVSPQSGHKAGLCQRPGTCLE